MVARRRRRRRRRCRTVAVVAQRRSDRAGRASADSSRTGRSFTGRGPLRAARTVRRAGGALPDIASRAGRSRRTSPPRASAPSPRPCARARRARRRGHGRSLHVVGPAESTSRRDVCTQWHCVRRVQISAKTDYAVRALCVLAAAPEGCSGEGGRPRRGAGRAADLPRADPARPAPGRASSRAAAAPTAATGWRARRTPSRWPTSCGSSTARSPSCTAPAPRRSAYQRARRAGAGRLGRRAGRRCARCWSARRSSRWCRTGCPPQVTDLSGDPRSWTSVWPLRGARSRPVPTLSG